MKNLHSILPACAVAVGVALVTVTSAFTEVPTNGKYAEYLYTYTGDDFSQTEIQNIDNYKRSDNSTACTGNTNVCGVLLPTDEGADNPPEQSEFDNAKAGLWAAQQDPSTAPNNVVLQP